MSNEQWNNLRARLNHDWLQNQYLVLLGARAHDPDWFKTPAGTQRLGEWRTQERDFDRFVQAAEYALSPLQLVDTPAFRAALGQSHGWVANELHERFLERSSIRDRLCEVRTRIADVAQAVHELLSGQISTPGILELRERCSELSRAISQLPREVDVL